jgi:subtilisin family serine protease
LSREQYVESAQRLSVFATSAGEPAAAGRYNDPYRNLQPGLESLQVIESHRWATGRGVRIAVIDTGLDTAHPEFKGRITGIRNFVDRDMDGFNADVHGTAVAAVIAAASNNGVGLIGVAPDASLIGLKACWQSDRASSGALCNTFTLAKALNFAIDQGVDVINLSLGGPEDALLTRLVNTALQRNAVVVGAASPKWPGGFPAGVKGVVAVRNGSEPQADEIAAHYLSAPGNQVLSAKPRNEYDFYSGSSFATAQVTGVTALIRQRRPDASGATILDLLTTTTQPDGHTANACRALSRIVPDTDCASSAKSAADE